MGWSGQRWVRVGDRKGEGDRGQKEKGEDARETDRQRQRKRDTGGVYPVLFVTVAVIHVAYEI